MEVPEEVLTTVLDSLSCRFDSKRISDIISLTYCVLRDLLGREPPIELVTVIVNTCLDLLKRGVRASSRGIVGAVLYLYFNYKDIPVNDRWVSQKLIRNVVGVSSSTIRNVIAWIELTLGGKRETEQYFEQLPTITC